MKNRSFFNHISNREANKRAGNKWYPMLEAIENHLDFIEAMVNKANKDRIMNNMMDNMSFRDTMKKIIQNKNEALLNSKHEFYCVEAFCKMYLTGIYL